MVRRVICEIKAFKHNYIQYAATTGNCGRHAGIAYVGLACDCFASWLGLATDTGLRNHPLSGHRLSLLTGETCLGAGQSLLSLGDAKGTRSSSASRLPRRPSALVHWLHKGTPALGPTELRTRPASYPLVATLPSAHPLPDLPVVKCRPLQNPMRMPCPAEYLPLGSRCHS